MPAITALAGLVPWAEMGISMTSRCVAAVCGMIGADGQQTGIFSLGAAVGLQRSSGKTGDLAQPVLPVRSGSSAGNLSTGRRVQKDAYLPNSGQLTGISSVAAFSFIVQDPSEIMEVFKERSLFSRLFR